MNFSAYLLVVLSGVFGFAFLGCSSENDSTIAGGVSEETNTVAGILTDANGTPIRKAIVLARHTSVDSVQFSDTTSEKGEFTFPVVRQGVYGISSEYNSQAFYKTVEYVGKAISIDAELRPVSSVSAAVSLSEGDELSGIEVRIPGTIWQTTTDSSGHFTLSDVPEGDYSLEIRSPDPGRYLNALVPLKLSGSDCNLGGPRPVEYRTEPSKKDTYTDSVIVLPLSTEYGLISWWPMDYISVARGDTVTTDARGRMGSAKIYGATLTKGAISKALHFENAAQFAVIEEDHGVLDSLTELTLEAFVKINDLKSYTGAYQKNVFGKLGFGSVNDQNVFSLAMINETCGAKNPTLAFFLASQPGAEFSCENAVVSSAKIAENEWIHVVVTWKNQALNIYLNGENVGSRPVGIKMLSPSDEPIFFGKEDFDFELDDVRLGAKAITSADVLYRYYQKTGGER